MCTLILKNQTCKVEYVKMFKKITANSHRYALTVVTKPDSMQKIYSALLEYSLLWNAAKCKLYLTA